MQREQTWLALMRHLRKQYPLAGGMWSTYTAKECIQWPIKSEPLLPDFIKPLTHTNAKVLLVSNSYDNTTPAIWSREVSVYLNKINIENKILTWQGAGHVAYHANSPLNGCVDTNVDQFFVTDKLPDITICNDKINPFEDTLAKHSNNKWLHNFLQTKP